MANAFMKRSGTMQIHTQSKDLEIKVLSHMCHDETTLGKHHKKWDWSFQLGAETQKWSLKVDEAVVGANTAEFVIDGKEIFKNKLSNDFTHKFPVRGVLKLDKQYEVKSMNSQDQWYPATLTGARGDGKYEAEVLMPPDQYGQQKKVHYPIVEANRIRDPFSKKVVDIPSILLQLVIKRQDALKPELTIASNPFTSYFCVPSPPVNKPKAEINFDVSKDRSTVKADVGHGKLKDALDATKPGAKVRSVAVKKSKKKCEWSIMIGAFGEHSIVLETKYNWTDVKKSQEMTLSIDGNLIVGGTAADLGTNEWTADVAIQGALLLKYKLHKTDANGNPIDETKEITKKMLRSNTLRITAPDHTNIEHATLECDEVDFGSLEHYKAPASESPISGSLETLESTHGISVPYAMDSSDSGGAGFAADFAEFIPGGSGMLNMFACCNQPTVDDDSQVVIGAGSTPASGSGGYAGGSQWKEPAPK